jgi:predicted nucleotidyltransferase
MGSKLLNQDDYNISMQLKSRLMDIADLKELRVFGSRADGRFDEDSDLDVYIEVESLDVIKKERMLDIIWEIGFNNDRLISPLIFTRDEVTNTPVRSSPIIKNIHENGILI